MTCAVTDSMSKGCWLGLVFTSFHQHRCDSSGFCGCWKWNARNKDFSPTERGSFHFQPHHCRWGGSLDAAEFPTNSHCWRCSSVGFEVFHNMDQTLIWSRTSPTAYNVFTGESRCIERSKPALILFIAYSITSAYESNGVCITTSGQPIKLSSAYSEILSAADGKVTLDANGQKQFVDYLGFSTCSVASANIGATALLQVTNTTATQTSTFSNVPLAAASASLTIAPVCRDHIGYSSRFLHADPNPSNHLRYLRRQEPSQAVLLLLSFHLLVHPR